MSTRPGGELATRPLHFIWIADCSGSMEPDGKIQGVTSENKLFDLVYAGRVHSPDNRGIMPLLKAANANTEVIPLVNNVDPFTNKWLESIGDFLNNAQART